MKVNGLFWVWLNLSSVLDWNNGKVFRAFLFFSPDGFIEVINLLADALEDLSPYFLFALGVAYFLGFAELICWLRTAVYFLPSISACWLNEVFVSVVYFDAAATIIAF